MKGECIGWYQVGKKLLWHFFVLQLSLILALRLSVKDSLIWFLEIFPPMFFLMHVLFITYDKKAFPEYRSAFVQVLEKCGRLRRSVVPCAIVVGLLLGIWVSMLAYFVDLGSAIFAGVAALLAFLLDSRKGWVGAKSMSCWILQRISLSRSRRWGV